ncbi:MAG: hypothetical protein FJ387_06440 [Verrucomicrobia bacterium]|nr:hypothetical protein [Verrucomicrobiota bacterium]
MSTSYHTELHKVVSVVALAFGIHAQANAGEPLNFTFGTPTSVTRTGFTKVTVIDTFTSARSYGFETAQGLLAFDRGGSAMVRPKDEYTASG